MSEDPRPREVPLSSDDYRVLFEESRDAVIFGTVDGLLRDINPAGVRLFGYDSKEDMLSLDIETDLHCGPADRQNIQTSLLTDNRVEDRELEIQTLSGERIRVEETASAIYDDKRELSGFLVTLRDVTEREHLQEQLRQSQRIATVGHLAEGVAHDFNNLLTAINGYSELILVHSPENDPARKGVTEIRKAGLRAAELTRRLLSLSRHKVVSPRRLDLSRVVSGMAKLLRRVIGEDVEIETLLASDLPPIFADQGEIEQIILNLAINARDAIPSGGRLTLETSRAENAADPQLELVEMAVRDTGEGLSSDIRGRIFEPLFTTRECCHHAGLGLAIVNRSVQECGGHVEVESSRGQGSVFRIFFPREEGSIDSIVDDQPLATLQSRGNETVLLVEDEASVRNLVQRILEFHGYLVLPAHDSKTALEICAQLSDQPDLLLTDVVMPLTSGAVLAERLRGRYPGLKVLFMSGYADSRIGVHLLNQRRAAFLAKPFAPQILARKVREVLDATPAQN